jgi:hypothetical protein
MRSAKLYSDGIDTRWREANVCILVMESQEEEEEEMKVQLEQYLVCGMSNNSKSVLCCCRILLSLN